MQSSERPEFLRIQLFISDNVTECAYAGNSRRNGWNGGAGCDRNTGVALPLVSRSRFAIPPLFVLKFFIRRWRRVGDADAVRQSLPSIAPSQNTGSVLPSAVGILKALGSPPKRVLRRLPRRCLGISYCVVRTGLSSGVTHNFDHHLAAADIGCHFASYADGFNLAPFALLIVGWGVRQKRCAWIEVGRLWLY